MYSFYQSFRYISIYPYAFRIVECRKCLQPDVGLGSGASAVEYWLSNLDDILVYSMDTWDHLKHLRSIMRLTPRQGSRFNLRRPRYFRQKPSI